MPLYKLEKLSSDRVTAIWLISESLEELLNIASVYIQGITIPEYINHPSKQIEWLASRLALKFCCDLMHIPYHGTSRTDTGQPLLIGNKAHISISHSVDFAAILLDTQQKVGIDIEKISTKVEKVANKYLREEEKESTHERLTLKWCIKEAVYKVSDHENLSLKDDIQILEINAKDTGNAKVMVRSCDSIDAFFFKLEDYYVAYTV
ncbi:MAG TPA: 4'-phosphopantetheinyl transferase superfamily protein [Cytophagaceae bacterium]|jgi:4'-phosphopantetheinyl transferase|nr:4'-phosphopantetheinyl transferase superfamily protein [Cytophagaceae bacterium]